jgi:tetratricopeptide (TPR) repeat protein
MTLPLPRLLLALCLTVLAARVAHANDPAERAAMRYFDRAEKLFALGKFDEALDEYQKAFDAKPLPAFLFNIGQCYRNLGDYQQAIFSYKKYLKLDPGAPNREHVQELIDDLEGKVEQGDSKRFRLDKDNETPPETTDKPIYKKWWFWTGLAVVGAAGGVGIYAATRPDGPPSTDLGRIVFGK